MFILSRLFKKVKDFISYKIEPPLLSYGILPVCKRCVYAKSKETVLIVSVTRGPRILIKPLDGCYVRVSDCIGIDKCGKCISDITINSLPCKWKKFAGNI